MQPTLKNLVGELNSNSGKYNIKKIKRSYFFAKKIYKDQIRQTGEPLIKHPLSVAISLAKWGLDESSIITALLHEIPDVKPDQYSNQINPLYRLS